METILKIPASQSLPERRRKSRATPDPYLVIRFDSGNTGVVLDVSLEGLGFLASAPVVEARDVRFEISSRTMPRFAAAGQLMWKDGSGKRAGLRFTQLPEELAILIRRCLPRSEAPARLSDGMVREPKTAVAGSVSAEQSLGVIPGVPSKRLALVANGVTWMLACLIALGIWHSVTGSRISDGFLPGKRSALEAWSLLRATSGRMGSSLRTFQKHEGLTTVEQKFTEASIRPELSFPFPFPERPLPISLEPVVAFDPTPNARVMAEPQAVRVQTSAAALPEPAARTAFLLAQKLLLEEPNPENQSKAAQLLWQAVEKGSVPAEVELAKLYLLGQGVAKSCGQARVLLTAAQNHKGGAAAGQIEDLQPYGCE
jgi:hypothetical protein